MIDLSAQSPSIRRRRSIEWVVEMKSDKQLTTRADLRGVRKKYLMYEIKIFIGHVRAPCNSHVQDTSGILELLVPNMYPRFQLFWKSGDLC